MIHGSHPSHPLVSPRNHRRYRSLDLWRGLICLLITAHHATHFERDRLSPGAWCEEPVGRLLFEPVVVGWVRVPMSFVISGFCISALCDKVRRQPRPCTQFLARRFRRIFLPCWAYLLGATVAGWFLWSAGWAEEVWGLPWGRWAILDPRALGIVQWVGNLTLTEPWRWHFTRGPIKWLVGTPREGLLSLHLWTLCLEVQFYAICCLILRLAPGRFFASLALVSAFALGQRATPLRFPADEWLFFAIGTLVYCQVSYFTAAQARWVCRLYLGIVLAELVCLESVGNSTPLARGLCASAAFALTLTALHPWDDRLQASRVLQPLAYCGRMSYSIYLVHLPVALAVACQMELLGVRGIWPTLIITLPLGLGTSVVLGLAFHHAIERRCLNEPLPSNHAWAKALVLKPPMPDEADKLAAPDRTLAASARPLEAPPGLA